jgi:RND family efflux transporter MFP subunit
MKILKKILSIVKKRWIIFLALFFVLGFGIYRQVKPKVNAGEITYTVKQQDLKEVLSFSGDIDAEEKVTLRFQTSGKLSWVGVKEGDYVKKFQTIATLDQREVKKKLEKELNEYLEERADFDQDFDDYEVVTSDTVKRILEKAQWGLNKAVLDVEIQNLSVEYSNLFTPIEGIVTNVLSPYAGVNVTPAQAEFEIVNPNTVYFLALVDQAEVISLSEEKKGYITFDSYPNEKLKTKVESISFIPRAGETGTVYEAKMSIATDNTNYKYRAGMTGDVEFIIKEKNNVLAVPSDFIKKEQGKKYVNVKDKNKRYKTFITAGVTIDDFTEIKSGLKEGDVVYD